MYRKERLILRGLPLIILFVGLCLLLANGPDTPSSVKSAKAATLKHRVNMPYLGSGPPVSNFTPSIFWFGQVTPTINNADVRMWYYDDYMKVMVNIIDRRLWYDTTPSTASLKEWDAVSIYLNRDGNSGQRPSANAFQFVSQLHRWEPNDGYQTSYRGNGSAWQTTPTLFTVESAYRGDNGPNSNFDDKGWQLTVVIPFSNFGLSGPPPTGTVWGLAVAVHDRDDALNSAIPDQIWPENMDPDTPSTWGQLHFGIPTYDSPNAIPKGITSIRQGLNGTSVIDGHVGGHGNCGSSLDHWTEWGEANYSGYTQINIQNQWDIADYPCFSKYFVTFPLESIPTDKVIISAELIMNMFGNAGGGVWGDPPDSYIQVLTIGEDWDENTLTWNNAPLAVENIAGTWVKPVQFGGQGEHSWDVTKAVIDALGTGNPLRLALYSADGERHSGKYFWSSDSNDWGGTVRPKLQVVWGDLCDSPGVNCSFIYMPAIVK